MTLFLLRCKSISSVEDNPLMHYNYLKASFEPLWLCTAQGKISQRHFQNPLLRLTISHFVLFDHNLVIALLYDCDTWAELD